MQNKKIKKYFLAFVSVLIIILLLLILLGNKPDNTHENGNASLCLTNDLSQAADGQKTELPCYLTLVNNDHPVPQDYNINLVTVKGGEKVDKRIYKPLKEMLTAAKEANQGKLPKVVSGYRTQDKQQKLYDEKIKEYLDEGYSDSDAVKMAEQWVAVPGFSEHQLGFAVDINGETDDLYSWLCQNSYKYGFIFRYPGNKTDITGIAEEVWHYRYVGIEAATEMYEKDLCLEEYLEAS